MSKTVKICPLMSRPVDKEDGFNEFLEVSCKKESCAWWIMLDPGEGWCSINSMVSALWALGNSVDGIELG
jgi:hypothetical protein